MTTKPTCLRLPVGILEAIDARKDANNDRTAIITSLLAAALSGEYIKPKDNTLNTIKHLSKTVKSLEAAIDELSFQIKKQTRINSQVDTSPIAESHTGSERNNSVVENAIDFDDEDLSIGEESDCEDIETEAEPDPIQFTHQEFIERFGCCRPNGFVVVLVDGDVCELVIVSRDAVLAIDSRIKEERRLSILEIAYYKLAVE